MIVQLELDLGIGIFALPRLFFLEVLNNRDVMTYCAIGTTSRI